MTGYRDIEFSRIAADWGSAPLGREDEPLLLVMRNGLTAEQDRDQGDLRVTRIETISDGYIAEDRVRYTSGLSPEQVEKFRIRTGDILFSHINSDPHLGKTAIARKDYDDLLHGMNLLLLRANRKVLNPQFLHFLCCYYRAKGVFVKICSRSVNQSSINQAKLKALEIPLPPLPEQSKIADVLGVVQQALEQQKRLLELTAELKKALLHQLFTAGIRGETKKETDIGPLPESWDVVELIRAVEQIDYGISAPIPKTPPDNAVKIVSTADITKDGRLLYWKIRRIAAPDKIVNRLTLQTGDVLFNWRNSAELIGKSAVFQEQDEPHIFASFILRIKCDERKCHNFFLAHLMNYFRETSVFLKLARRAVNQANYNRNEISVLKIPIPTYREQREIADAIAGVDTKLHHHRQKKAKLEDLFRTLLHQLMTAQIRVHEIDV